MALNSWVTVNVQRDGRSSQMTVSGQRSVLSFISMCSKQCLLMIFKDILLEFEKAHSLFQKEVVFVYCLYLVILCLQSKTFTKVANFIIEKKIPTRPCLRGLRAKISLLISAFSFPVAQKVEPHLVSSLHSMSNQRYLLVAWTT